MINRYWRWFLYGFAFLLLTGCTVSATYNNLDRLARWQIADYVDFDDRQDAYFRAELDRLLYWHRVSELPVYADRLDQLVREINQEFTAPTLAAMIEDVTTWAERIEAEAMTMTIELMLSLTDAQVAELPANLEKANDEFAGEHHPDDGAARKAAGQRSANRRSRNAQMTERYRNSLPNNTP